MGDRESRKQDAYEERMAEKRRGNTRSVHPYYCCCATCLDPEPEYLDGDASIPCTCPEGFHTPGGCDGDE